MRLLFLTHTVSWRGGGIFYTAYHQGRHLVQRGHDVTLMSISANARIKFSESIVSGVHIVETPDLFSGKGRSGWDPWDILQRLGYLNLRKYDLVHGYESRPVVALPGLSIQKKQHIPLVFTWADWFGKGGKSEERGRLLAPVMAPVENFCEEYFYPKADGLVAMGAPLQERALSLGIAPEKIITLLHGCDTKNFLPIPKQEARERLSMFQKDEIVFGYLGVLRPSSARLLLQAFQIIQKRFPGSCKLVFIGNNKLQLDDYVPEDCRQNIIETGWLSYEDVNLYLAASDILALPLCRAVATNNVWPSKLNDYLSAGRPVVATRMRVFEPLFRKYTPGLLTEDNPQEFAQGCLKLIADNSLGCQMGENARKLAEGELSWEVLVNGLEKFYVNLINGCL